MQEGRIFIVLLESIDIHHKNIQLDQSQRVVKKWKVPLSGIQEGYLDTFTLKVMGRIFAELGGQAICFDAL